MPKIFTRFLVENLLEGDRLGDLPLRFEYNWNDV